MIVFLNCREIQTQHNNGHADSTTCSLRIFSGVEDRSNTPHRPCLGKLEGYKPTAADLDIHSDPAVSEKNL